MSRAARILSVALILGLAAALAACGTGGGQGGGEEGGGKIALLLPESKTTRYERHDRPIFTQAVKKLCPDCEILYSNADQDAAKQQQQAEAAITNGAEVLVLDPVDAEAASAIVERAKQSDIPVLSYDRLVQNADLDGYISFDNERVGRLQGQWIVENVPEGGTIVMINGAPTDPNAALFKRGAHSVIDPSGIEIGAEYDTPDWSPDAAQRQMDQAITRLGRDNIDGVYAANDGTAGGAIAAMRAAGFQEIPPTTGQDAELAAVQRILAGTQGMTVYKAIREEATTAAEMAVSLLRTGELPRDLETTGVDNGREEVPSVLLKPVVVTKDNIEETIIADRFWTVDEICTPEFRDACREAGLIE
ncbi:D-xylose-binding periplasmic protein [Rubrobacter xylanophilus DSM 9941]|uniref:ABC transporter substrate-binding protein n=1 Tax=Rubrobacter xylanophilus TaxID=49319 RepID=UPI001C63D4FF|nr:sugar ABC transporter substrate-binding protein [Rubrobacter xylanophilus]QYJ16409.1 D-xylose-binding periplasmic protein [Rubrobacter xylanophilus DSM 9941]